MYLSLLLHDAQNIKIQLYTGIVDVASYTTAWCTRSCHKFCYKYHAVREKGVRICARVYQEDVVQRAVKLLTQLSSMVRNGSPSWTQLLPKRPRRLRSGCVGTFRHLSAPTIGPRWVQPSTPTRDYKLRAVLDDMTCRKRHNNLDRLKRSPWSRCVPR